MPIIRFIVPALLFTLLPFWGQGQVYMGVQGGYTASKAKLMNPYQSTQMVYNSTLDYGLIFKYFNPNPNPNFLDERIAGVQIELLTSPHGYRTRFSADDTVSIPEKHVSNYLMLPALAQFRIGIKKMVYFHINAGPYLSYMLKAQHGSMTNGKFDMHPYKINPLRDNRFDYGIIAGVGISFDMFFGTLQAEFRYGYGLGDLYNVSYPGNHSQSPATFQSGTLSYMYRLKSRRNH